MDAAPRGRHTRGQTPASPRVPLFTFPGAPRRQQVPGVGTEVPRKAGTAPNALLNPHGQSQWFRELKETGPPSLTTSKRILLRLLCNNAARTRPQAVGRASEEARMGGDRQEGLPPRAGWAPACVSGQKQGWFVRRAGPPASSRHGHSL